MVTLVDPRFQEEAEVYGLRFTCEECAHFDSETERCGNGYPNHEHRNRSLTDADYVVFCKDFELA